MCKLWAGSDGGALHYIISFNAHKNIFQEGTIITISQIRIMRSEKLGDSFNVTQIKRGRARQN